MISHMNPNGIVVFIKENSIKSMLLPSDPWEGVRRMSMGLGHFHYPNSQITDKSLPQYIYIYVYNNEFKIQNTNGGILTTGRSLGQLEGSLIFLVNLGYILNHEEEMIDGIAYTYTLQEWKEEDL